jgi:hypothetical protein
VRDYGLMTANPFGLHEFFQDESRDGSYELSAGAELTFRYRVFIHRGDARRGKVAARYHHFANPPQIRIDRKPPRLGGISLKSDQLLALDNCGGIHSANRIARQ